MTTDAYPARLCLGSSGSRSPHVSSNAWLASISAASFSHVFARLAKVCRASGVAEALLAQIRLFGVGHGVGNGAGRENRLAVFKRAWSCWADTLSAIFHLRFNHLPESLGFGGTMTKYSRRASCKPIANQSIPDPFAYCSLNVGKSARSRFQLRSRPCLINREIGKRLVNVRSAPKSGHS